MFIKLFLFLLLICSIIFSQDRITVSGTVKDSRTNQPIGNAKVTLSGPDIETETGTNGIFSIAGSAVLRTRHGVSNGAPINRADHFVYYHQKAGPIQIRILNLSGRRVASIFSGTLERGNWNVSLPKLLPGVYVCTFATPHTYTAIRFLTSSTSTPVTTGSSIKPVANSMSSTNALSKRNSSSQYIDSLLIEKTGYRSLYLPLTNYNVTGLEILLEDTTASNTEEVTIIPDASWTCFMPKGIPPPHLGKPVFGITLKYDAIRDAGETKFGYRRFSVIRSGTVKGDDINATVLDGGLDYELTLSTGSMEFEQIIIFRADRTPVLMRNAGVAPPGADRGRMVLDFEAPNSSSYKWLHTGMFAAERIIDSTKKTITLDVFDISDVALTEKRIKIKDPEGVPHQTWECLKASGRKGTTVFTENVKLGGSISIGQSKRGRRNIIPITGGTTKGRIKAKILNAGADYQLGGLDARYVLEPEEGEFIIVRNCGGTGALIPVFETRLEGSYDFLNENKYVSSMPGMVIGGITITFYERN